MLTISGYTLDDFGSYSVVLQNTAGKASHVIDVITPEVFPYATCDQGDTIQLVCNVTSCSDVSLSWIHSVDDVIIRKLSGNQDGTVNTLTIPMCMYSDAGIYTCVGTDEETGSDVVINHDKTTLAVKSVAVLLEPNVTIQSTRILIEVPFFAKPSARRITWYRNGERINVIEKETRNVDVSIHGTIKQFSGHVTSLRVASPSAQNFGIYKIEITNEMGTSEHTIDAQNPQYAIPITGSDTRVTYDGGSANLIMDFTTYYPQSGVKWYYKGNEVHKNHPSNKYVMQTCGMSSDVGQTVRYKNTMSSTLTVTCLTEEDYGIYEAVVSNQAGTTVVPVKLTVNGQGIPKLVSGLSANNTNSKVEITATFYSPSGYKLINCLKGDKEIIANDTLKYNIVNEVTRIETRTNGEMMEATGVITRLSVTSLTDQDYGLYTVQIYNDFGMTDSSVMLDKKCT